jgi:hypothetical protein
MKYGMDMKCIPLQLDPPGFAKIIKSVAWVIHAKFLKFSKP